MKTAKRPLYWTEFWTWGAKMQLNAMNDGCDGEIEMKTSSLLARTTARKIVKSMFPVVFLRKVKLIFGLAIY